MANNVNDMYDLKLRTIIAFVKHEKISYSLILFYMFMEYFRPQTIYPAIDILPYAMITILSCLVVFILESNNFVVKNISNKLIILFGAVIILSTFFGLSFENSFSNWYLFISWLLIYFLIINIVNTESRILVFMLLFLLCSFKMGQFSVRRWLLGGMGYSTYGFGGGPGWFQNSGEFGIQMCVYFPIATYFYFTLKKNWPKWKKWLLAAMPVIGFLGMISSSNRGTLVGGAAVILWMLLKSKHKVKVVPALALVLVLAFQLIPDEQFARFSQAGEDKTSVERIENWKKGLKMAEMYPILGVGYKNWQIADRMYFDGNGLLSHNIFIECMSELGYIGLLIFLLLIIATFWNNHETRKLALAGDNGNNEFIYNMAHALDAALIGYLASGFFVTVLYYPYFWINLSMTVALNNVAKAQFRLIGKNGPYSST
jgi:putative inorganic carbon (HCO3(-)) transporter